MDAYLNVKEGIKHPAARQLQASTTRGTFLAAYKLRSQDGEHECR
jgi:hypothetical protein